MKRKTLLMISLISLAALTGCEDKSKQYTVTFNSQGGSDVASQVISGGNKVVEPKSPSRKGYIFDKWTLDSEGKNDYQFNTSVNSSFELFAQWSNNFFVVTFDSDGGTTVASQNVKEDGLALEPSAPIKKGYTFLEWQLNDTKFDFNTPINSNITLKAKYGTNVETVTTKSDSPTRGTVSISRKYSHGEVANVVATPNGGFDFTGWYNGFNKVCDHETYSFIVDGDVTLTAKFVPIEYTINYNNVTSEEHNNPKTYNFENNTIKLKDASRTNQVFAGWYKDSDFKEEDKITEINPAEHIGKMNLYAKWEDVPQDKFMVTFDARCITEDTISSQVIDNGSKATKPDYVPKWATIEGWYYKDNGVETKFDFENITVNKNYDLYAKYKDIDTTATPNLTYNLNSSNGYSVSITNDVPYKYEKNIIIPSVVEINIPESGNTYYIAVNEITTCNGLDTYSVSVPPTVDVIAEHAFENCKLLNTITFRETDTIKSDLTCISAKAFSGCVKLANITLPSDLLIIKDDAFNSCTNLKKINIPKKVTLYNNVFSGCNGLKFTFADDCLFYTNEINGTTYENAIFEYENEQLTQFNLVCATGNIALTYDTPIIKILNKAMSQTNLTAITIPNSVTEIEDEAFSLNNTLATITIDKDNSNLKTIGYRAFYRCGFTSIIIPNSVQSIGIEAFESCNYLADVTFGENINITTISRACFASSNITNINIPDCIEEFGDYSFYNTPNITFHFGANTKIKTFGVNAFAGSRMESFKVPSTVTEIKPGAFEYLSKIKTIYIDSINVANFTNNESKVFINGQVDTLTRTVYVKSDIVVSPSSYLITGGFTRGEEVEGYVAYRKA